MLFPRLISQTFELCSALCRLMAEWRGIKAWRSCKDPEAAIVLGRDGFEAFPVSEGNLSLWRMRFLGGGFGLPDYINDDTCKFKGACFEAELKFCSEYPFQPPQFKFIEPIPYHPNVYHDDSQHGNICISMLHKPGTDAFNAGESMDQRWKSDYTIRAIGVNVLDLLGHPNMGGGTPASAAINGVLRDPKGIAIFQAKTEECAKLSRDKAPKDVFERAALEKAEYDSIHAAYYAQLAADRCRFEEEARAAAAAATLDPEKQSPIGGFDDDDTPSAGCVNVKFAEHARGAALTLQLLPSNVF
jgi:ubiquitin-conjugating enzyme E2 G1